MHITYRKQWEIIWERDNLGDRLSLTARPRSICHHSDGWEVKNKNRYIKTWSNNRINANNKKQRKETACYSPEPNISLTIVAFFEVGNNRTFGQGELFVPLTGDNQPLLSFIQRNLYWQCVGTSLPIISQRIVVCEEFVLNFFLSFL